MNDSSKYLLRAISKGNIPFLWEMLYQAIYVSSDHSLPSRAIIQSPELAKYVEAWGKQHDDGFIAIEKESQQQVGVIWIRLFDEYNQGYGYVNPHTPELSMAVLPEYRRKGLGAELLARMLLHMKQNEYQAVSLSVSPENPAKRLYERFGFKETGIISGTSITMLKTLP